MDPGPGGVGFFANLGERITGPGIDVSCLSTNNRRAGNLGQQLGSHAALLIHWYFYDAPAAQTEHPQSLKQTGMPFPPSQNIAGGRPKEALPSNTPPRLFQYGVTSRGQ